MSKFTVEDDDGRRVDWTSAGVDGLLWRRAGANTSSVELWLSGACAANMTLEQAADLRTALQLLLSDAPTRVPRMKDGPANQGKPWSDEHDAELTRMWLGGVPVKELAVQYSRTTGAIASRLVRLGLAPDKAAARRGPVGGG